MIFGKPCFGRTNEAQTASSQISTAPDRVIKLSISVKIECIYGKITTPSIIFPALNRHNDGMATICFIIASEARNFSCKLTFSNRNRAMGYTCFINRIARFLSSNCHDIDRQVNSHINVGMCIRMAEMRRPASNPVSHDTTNQTCFATGLFCTVEQAR